MENGALAHVGIMGMRWGYSRNGGSGNPSPKGGQRTKDRGGSKEANAKKTESLMKDQISSNAKSLYKNRKMFTTTEMETAVKRLRLENEVGKMSKAETGKGMDIAKSILGTVKFGLEAYGTFQAIQLVAKNLKKVAPIAEKVLVKAVDVAG